MMIMKDVNKLKMEATDMEESTAVITALLHLN